MASIFKGLNLKIDAIFVLKINLSHLDLAESGAIPTDRRIVERRNMQIGNRVDCSYGVPYQKNRRELQDTSFPQIKNAHSAQEEEKFEENFT